MSHFACPGCNNLLGEWIAGRFVARVSLGRGKRVLVFPVGPEEANCERCGRSWKPSEVQEKTLPGERPALTG